LHINKIIEDTLEELRKLKMINYDQKNQILGAVDLGRICSHYYVRTETIDIYCKEFGITFDEEDVENEAEMKKRRNAYRSDLEILKILASAKEFEEIKTRPEEYEELRHVATKEWVLD
jgi:activating signal cointegrator complex subunit 3